MENKKVNEWVAYVIIASIAILIIVILYYFIFRNWNGCDHAEVLGQFGDFIGGTTGPLLSIMAIFGALIAVTISTSELRLQRIQSQKSDIFQIIGVIHSECISLLESKKFYKEDLSSPEDPIERTLTSFFKEHSVFGEDDYATGVNMLTWNKVRMLYADELRDLANRIVALRKYLQQYEHLSDNNYYISEYYKVFYYRYALKLKQLGYLPEEIYPYYEERKLNYFDSSKEKLKPTSG